MKYLKIIILFFSITVLAQSGKVVKVKDGDTIVVLDDQNVQTTLRLAEVDCPESSQPFGQRAKIFCISEVAMKQVTYEVISKDRYGRSIAKVFYSGKYLSEELIRSGFGWHYKRYSTSKKLATLEENAKKNKKGLWIESQPLAPWEYRKIKTNKYKTYSTY
jgi:micrococcal nuclease